MNQQITQDFYNKVVENVILAVKETYIRDNQSEDVIDNLKKMWLEKLRQTKNFQNDPDQLSPPQQVNMEKVKIAPNPSLPFNPMMPIYPNYYFNHPMSPFIMENINFPRTDPKLIKNQRHQHKSPNHSRSMKRDSGYLGYDGIGGSSDNSDSNPNPEIDNNSEFQDDDEERDFEELRQKNLEEDKKPDDLVSISNPESNPTPNTIFKHLVSSNGTQLNDSISEMPSMSPFLPPEPIMRHPIPYFPPQNVQPSEKTTQEEDENLSEELSSSEDSEGGDPENYDLIITQYDKVHRTKQKYKCVFTDAVFKINQKDHVFHKISADIEY